MNLSELRAATFDGRLHQTGTALLQTEQRSQELMNQREPQLQAEMRNQLQAAAAQPAQQQQQAERFLEAQVAAMDTRLGIERPGRQGLAEIISRYPEGTDPRQAILDAVFRPRV